MSFYRPTGGSISAKTVGIFAAIGALLGGVDGATAAGFQEAVTFAIIGGLIGGAVGISVGRDQRQGPPPQGHEAPVYKATWAAAKLGFFTGPPYQQALSLGVNH
jgi:hypothetical protein